MIQCRFLTSEQYRARNDERKEAIGKWREAHPDVDTSKGWPPELRALSETYLPPGTMYYADWWHDPSDAQDMSRYEKHLAEARRDPNQGANHLSVHYWETWAKVRPPIMVICPGGGHWCPDQVSSNGTGWTVTGEVPNITCNPSIWSSQGAGPPHEYHGWLQNGVFSDPV